MRHCDQEFIPTRRSLLSRLKNWDDQESWSEFFRVYWKLIYRAALKAGLTEEEAQDVVQETVLSVSKSMPGFQYDPSLSFKQWLLQLTRWRIADQLRKRRPEIAAWEPSVDPWVPEWEEVWESEWKQNLFNAAVERVKREADPKQYQIFDLYVFKKWPVKKICATLAVNPATVYLTRHRVSALIKREVKSLEKLTETGSFGPLSQLSTTTKP